MLSTVHLHKYIKADDTKHFIESVRYNDQAHADLGYVIHHLVRPGWSCASGEIFHPTGIDPPVSHLARFVLPESILAPSLANIQSQLKTSSVVPL